MTWILPKQLHISACALDTEALSLDCTEQSEICARSLFVRSKPSPLRTWLAKWKRDSWTQHLSGRILRPSLGQRFATEWTSSLEATPANPSVQPDSAKVNKTRGIYGRLLQMAFDFSDPGAASLRTSKDISAWGCPTSSKTWLEWVTERRGAYSARLNAARHTSASGCSSWPSPVASEVRQGFQDRSRGMKGSQESLTTVVIKSWPTPSGMDGERPQETQEQWEQRNARKKSANPNLGQLHRPLTVAVTAMHGPHAPASSSTDGSRQGLSWPTPQTMDVLPVRPVETFAESNRTRGGRKNRQALSNLREAIHSPVYQVKSWATPDASDRRSDNCRQIGLSNQTQGKLNPRWVETLMGLPVGWTMPSCVSPVTIERTNSDYSGMELYQPPQNEPSEC